MEEEKSVKEENGETGSKVAVIGKTENEGVEDRAKTGVGKNNQVVERQLYINSGKFTKIDSL